MQVTLQSYMIVGVSITHFNCQDSGGVGVGGAKVGGEIRCGLTNYIQFTCWDVRCGEREGQLNNFVMLGNFRQIATFGVPYLQEFLSFEVLNNYTLY